MRLSIASVDRDPVGRGFVQINRGGRELTPARILSFCAFLSNRTPLAIPFFAEAAESFIS